MTPLVLLIILVFSACYSVMGLANCTLSELTASFGSVTSFVAGTTVSTTSAIGNINCDSKKIDGLQSIDSISFSLTAASNVFGTHAVMTRQGDTSNHYIPLQLCLTPECHSEMTPGGRAITWDFQQLLSLSQHSIGNVAIPFYLRTLLPVQPMEAGTYTARLNVAVSWRFCTTSVMAEEPCPLNRLQEETGIISMAVNLTVINDCRTITAPNINFGSAPLVSEFSTVTQSISIACTKGSTYSIGFNDGENAVSHIRNMISGNRRLSYEIYKGRTTERWGANSSERMSSANANSISNDGMIRTFNYTSKILTTQATPEEGNYNDNVVVDVAF